MAITRAGLIAFAKTLSHNTASTVTLGESYDEVVEQLAKLTEPPNPPVVATTGLTISSGTASYTYPTGAVSILGVFDRGRQLHEVSHQELNSYGLTWRDDTGDPVAYYVEEESADSIRLYPTPSTTSTGQWLYTHASTSLSDHLALHVMFSMLQFEFEYPSDHQDKEAAIAWGALADIFAGLAGLTEEGYEQR